MQETRQNSEAEIARFNKELELSQNDISLLVTEVANQTEKYEHREEERYSIVRHRDREFKRHAEIQSHTEQLLDESNTNAEQLQHQLDASNAQLQAADKDKQALTAEVDSLQVNVDQRFEELAKLSQHLTKIEDSRLSSKIRNAGKLLRPRKS